MDLGLCNSEGERAPVPEFIPECPGAPKCPPPRPLLPTPPLSSGSPSARPQLILSAVRAPQVCHSPSSPWLENPLPRPPASETQTPPLAIDPAASPWLLAPSSMPWPISPLALPGSLVQSRCEEIPVEIRLSIRPSESPRSGNSDKKTSAICTVLKNPTCPRA
ncbi:vegetative cell wall protein gp1-like [Sinocyclocheilus rhinocerous]|uniref:vegetative cell wall protein gp1-like n=1 Tax=Sinocyclocheilus rhinocerous TaxID=307959 RepID=UPI0007B9CC96|nr:PREDICTED: vegetative cell wall protein gp1-like [Sinocyclocheilus rhinocerous]